MIIPDEIKRSYQAGRHHPLAASLCDAIRWVMAGWLETEFRQYHVVGVPSNQCLFCSMRGQIDPGHSRTSADWLADADRLLMEIESKKNA